MAEQARAVSQKAVAERNPKFENPGEKVDVHFFDKCAKEDVMDVAFDLQMEYNKALFLRKELKEVCKVPPLEGAPLERERERESERASGGERERESERERERERAR